MSRLDSVRNMIRGAAPAIKSAGSAGIAAGAAGTGIALYNDKNLNQSLDIGKTTGVGALTGIAAGALSPYAKTLPSALKSAYKAGSFKGGASVFGKAMSSVSTSFGSMAKGGLLGAGLGLGYAVLQSNKSVNPSYSDRLKFETARKKMTVEENLRQMKEMREIMASTRLK